MRILFSFIGGLGHFHPLVPIARAAQSAGHEVAVAGTGTRQAEIAAAGFHGFATSPVRLPSRTPLDQPLEPYDEVAAQLHLRDGFAGRGARRHAAALTEIGREWAPDLVVRDEVDFGSAIAAECLGIPCVSVVVLPAGGFLTRELVAPNLHDLRQEYGLSHDPELAMLDGDLVLSPAPPLFRDPAHPLTGHVRAFHPRPVIATPPDQLEPTVYATLGTVDVNIDLLRRLTAGLAALGANLVVTVGSGLDPAVLGPQPSHVLVEQFVAQDTLLPQCALVVSHGGSGTVLGALAHGVPSLLLPIGADQPHNARRCVALGAGRILDPVDADPSEIGSVAAEMLAKPSYAEAATRVRGAFNALPGVDQVVALLEGLG